MPDDSVLILGAEEVEALLARREAEVIEVVERIYRAHGKGQSSLPPSAFLSFPDCPTNRIIALPAFIGDGFQAAGVKWISSFPGNLQHGMPRASAVIILNSCETGRPEAILEGSIISTQRTAAGAALAARVLLDGRAPETAGLVGTGPINREIARFLLSALPSIARFMMFDLDLERAARLAADLRASAPASTQFEIVPSVDQVLQSCPLISFATTANRPHVHDLSLCPAGTVVLHVSLRDLAPEVILACDNVVDDIDHICRAQTSVHLAEQLTGRRDFIRCTLAEILEGSSPARRAEAETTVFSPFGLGVLDVALGGQVLELARARSMGTTLKAFLRSGNA